MSSTFSYALFKGGTWADALADMGAFESAPNAVGWTCAHFTFGSPRDLEAHLAAHIDSAPILLGYVETSDFAYAWARSSGGKETRLVLNPEAAAELQLGAWAVDACRQAGGRDWRRGAAQGMAEFSLDAPSPITLERAEEIISVRWTLAEEGLFALLDALGLSLSETDNSLREYEGAVSLQDRGRSVLRRGVKIDWTKSRFVIGQGADFVGIWDRKEKGPPIRRFAPDYPGMVLAREEVLRLNGRWAAASFASLLRRLDPYVQRARDRHSSQER